MEERTTIQVSNEIRKQLKILSSERDCSYEELLADLMKNSAALDKSKTVIYIPTPLVEKIKARSEETGFNSVSEYATYIFSQVLASLDQRSAQASASENKPAEKSAEDENKQKKEVIKRLQSLGYLD